MAMMQQRHILTFFFVSAFPSFSNRHDLGGQVQVVSHNLTTREVAQPYDLNGDGQVTKDEAFLGEYYLGLYYFRAMDKNGDEAITRDELRTTDMQYGYEADVIERHATEDFDWADTNDDNKWDIGEYLRWWTWDSSEEEIGEDFRAVDKDGNGRVSEEELRRSYEAIGVDENLLGEYPKTFIQKLDNNGDNMLNLVEWAEA